MTLRKSNPVSVTGLMPGDLVRIAVANGACIAALGGVSSHLTKGAFGRMGADGNIVMHEMMPTEFVALREIKVTPQTQVERISMDSENEAGILALQYLQTLSEFVKSRAAGQEHIRPLLVAMLKTETERVSQKLAESGMSVVEVLSTESVVKKKVYITNDPDSIRDGAIPIDAVAFDIAPENKHETTVEVYDAQRAQEVIFNDRRVSEGAPRAADPAPAIAANLSPLMRSLVGIEGLEGGTLTGNDLGLGSFEEDVPGMVG